MYRLPTNLEREFLRVITRGYPELERQIESCEIADYDPVGWCNVHVIEGPPSPIRFMAEGPTLLMVDPQMFIEILIWTNEIGMLSKIEIVEYGSHLDDPYATFVAASSAVPPCLKYRV